MLIDHFSPPAKRKYRKVATGTARTKPKSQMARKKPRIHATMDRARFRTTARSREDVISPGFFPLVGLRRVWNRSWPKAKRAKARHGMPSAMGKRAARLPWGGSQKRSRAARR